MNESKSINHFSEAAWLIGQILIALGTVMMVRGDFGVSMVVAPAYLISQKIGLTFGTTEYLFQAVLLAVMCLVIRRFKATYLFAFFTAVVYGAMVDGFTLLIGLVTWDGMLFRATVWVLGMVLVAAGVSFCYHTYLAPEVYELFVKEVSGAFGWEIHRFKLFYDGFSCLFGIVLSYLFFGELRGIWFGTALCALLNGHLIGYFSHLFEKHIDFSPRFPAMARWMKI